MIVDYERVALALKARLADKKSWGARELYALIAQLEVECAVSEEGFDPTPVRRPTSGRPVEVARNGH